MSVTARPSSQHCRHLLTAAAACVVAATAATAAPLPNGIYVERVGGTNSFGAGTGIADNVTGLPVFVDSFSFTSAAAPQLTIAFPTTSTPGSRALTDLGHPGGSIGSATSAAVNIMQLSPDKRYLTVAGYDDPAGSEVRRPVSEGGTGGGVKTIGVIDTTTGAVSTQFGFSSTAQPRSVVTTNNVDFWFVGSSNAIRYYTPPANPDSTPNATQISLNNVNQRTGAVFGGQLFLSGPSSIATNSGAQPGIAVIGVGTPKPPESNVTQTYIMTTAANPEQFVMLDLDPAKSYVNGTLDTGLDTTYVATSAGVEKWLFDGSIWVKQYTLNDGISSDPSSKLGGGAIGLAYAGKDAAGNPVLYATTFGNNEQTTAPQGNALLTLTDTGAAAAWSVVATSPDNTWFRGVQALGTVPITPALVGDTNDDGVVDLADLNNVLNNFGATGSSPGDDNGDGVVDLADLNNVLNNFGNTATTSALSVVPEPSSLACLFATLPFLTRRRRN